MRNYFWIAVLAVMLLASGYNVYAQASPAPIYYLHATDAGDALQIVCAGGVVTFWQGVDEVDGGIVFCDPLAATVPTIPAIPTPYPTAKPLGGTVPVIGTPVPIHFDEDVYLPFVAGD